MRGLGTWSCRRGSCGRDRCHEQEKDLYPRPKWVPLTSVATGVLSPKGTSAGITCSESHHTLGGRICANGTCWPRGCSTGLVGCTGLGLPGWLLASPTPKFFCVALPPQDVFLYLGVPLSLWLANSPCRPIWLQPVVLCLRLFSAGITGVSSYVCLDLLSIGNQPNREHSDKINMHSKQLHEITE